MTERGGDVAISKTQRWLDLIVFLVKRRFPAPVDEIMEGVPAYAAKWRTEDATKQASVRRMFERDKDELRAAGIPLETVEYRVEGAEPGLGYRLAAGDFYLPYLRLVGGATSTSSSTSKGGEGAASVEVTAEEARLAMDALQRVIELPDSPFAAEARSALNKLRFDLVPPVVEEEAEEAEEAVALLDAASPDALHEATRLLYAEPPGPSVRDTVRLLTDALRRRARVTFTYHGIRRGAATERDVAPYGLLYQYAHWYVIGHDATRDAIRVFRLSRMEGVEAGDDAAFEHDPDFDVSAYAGREAWELGDDRPLAADVRFDFPLSLWADRNAKGRELERLAGGAVVRRFDVRQTDPFLRWLQSFAGDAVVTAPPELRRAQAELARATAARYGGTGELDEPGEANGA